MIWAIAHWKWIAGALLALGLVWGGYSIRINHANKQAVAASAEAGKKISTANDALAKGENNAAAAKAKEPDSKASAAAVDQARAQLVKDSAAKAKRPMRPQPDPTSPGPQPVVDPVDVDKDHLIAALDKRVSDLAAERDFYKSAYELAHAAAVDFKGAEESQRTATAALQGQSRPWAVGGGYGTTGLLTVAVERDLGPFRVAVQATRRVLPSGNATVDASGIVYWRF